MKAVSIKCPNCGAGVYVDEGKTRCFCSNCGSPIIIDPEIETHVNVNVSYDKTREYELTLEEKKHQTAMDRVNANIKRAKKVLLISGIVLVMTIVILNVLNKVLVESEMPMFVQAILTISLVGSALLIFSFFIVLMSNYEKRDKLDGVA